jgi:NADH dehydrogenase FAD-containing subunit
VEGGPHVLGAYPEALRVSALAQLRKLGVEVRLGARVTDISDGRVTIAENAPSVEAVPAAANDAKTQAASVSNGGLLREQSPLIENSRTYDINRTAHANVAIYGNDNNPSSAIGISTVLISAETIIWAAGVAASPLAQGLAAQTGASLDRAGRISVLPDLSLAQFPAISVVGDMAAVRSYASPADTEGRPVPGVSPGAKQAGRHAARMVLRRLRGAGTTPFRYIDYGDLATIGRKAAVAKVSMPLLGDVRFSGLPAWLFWLFVHIYFLIGFRNRLMVMADWAWSYFTFDRAARVVADAPASVSAHPMEMPMERTSSTIALETPMERVSSTMSPQKP